MCFHEFDNKYDALNKNFYISDYLQDKTWPNEIGEYITPEVTMTSLFAYTKGFKTGFTKADFFQKSYK